MSLCLCKQALAHRTLCPGRETQPLESVHKDLSLKKKQKKKTETSWHGPASVFWRSRQKFWLIFRENQIKAFRAPEQKSRTLPEENKVWNHGPHTRGEVKRTQSKNGKQMSGLNKVTQAINKVLEQGSGSGKSKCWGRSKRNEINKKVHWLSVQCELFI